MSYTGSINQFTKVMTDAWQEVTQLKPDDSQRNIESVIKTLSQIRPPMNSSDIKNLTSKIKNVIKMLNQANLPKGRVAEIQLQFFESCFPEPTNFSILGELSNITKMAGSNDRQRIEILKKLFNAPGRFNQLVKACDACLAKGDKNEIENLLDVLYRNEPRYLKDYEPKYEMIFGLFVLSSRLKGTLFLEFLAQNKPIGIYRIIQEAEHELALEKPNLLSLFEATKNKIEGKGVYYPPQKRIGEIWEAAQKIQSEIRNSHDLSNVSSSKRMEIQDKINAEIDKQIDAAFPSLKAELSQHLRAKTISVLGRDHRAPKTTFDMIEILYKRELHSAFNQMKKFSENNDFQGAKEVLNKLSPSDKQMLLQVAFDQYEDYNYDSPVILQTFLFIIKNINEMNPAMLSRLENCFTEKFDDLSLSGQYPRDYTQIIETLLFTKNIQDFYENILASVQRCYAAGNIRWQAQIAPLLILLGIVESPEELIQSIRNANKKNADQIISLFNKYLGQQFSPSKISTYEQMQIVQRCRMAARKELQKEMKTDLDTLYPTHGLFSGPLGIVEGYAEDFSKVAQRTLQLMDKKFRDLGESKPTEYIENGESVPIIERQYKEELDLAYNQMEILSHEGNNKAALEILEGLKPNAKQLLLELAIDRYKNEGLTRFPTFLFILKNIDTVGPSMIWRLKMDFRDIFAKQMGNVTQEYLQIIEAMMSAHNLVDFYEDLKSLVQRNFLYANVNQIDVQCSLAPLFILLNIVKEPWEVLKIIKDSYSDEEYAQSIVDEFNKRGVVDQMRHAMECRKLAQAELEQTVDSPENDAALVRLSMMHFRKL